LRSRREEKTSRHRDIEKVLIVFLVLIEIEKEADSRAAENLQDQQDLVQQERRKDIETSRHRESFDIFFSFD